MPNQIKANPLHNEFENVRKTSMMRPGESRSQYPVANILRQYASHQKFTYDFLMSKLDENPEQDFQSGITLPGSGAQCLTTTTMLKNAIDNHIRTFVHNPHLKTIENDHELSSLLVR
jgi:hypothetical protein